MANRQGQGQGRPSGRGRRFRPPTPEAQTPIAKWSSNGVHPTDVWTPESLQAWERRDFTPDSPLRWRRGYEPPYDLTASHRWYPYFKRIEAYLKTMNDEEEGTTFFYLEGERVAYEALEMLRAADELMEFDKSAFFQKQIDRRLFFIAVHRIVEILRENHSQPNYVGEFFRKRFLKRHLSKFIDGFQLLAGRARSCDAWLGNHPTQQEQQEVHDLLYRLFMNIGDMFRYCPQGTPVLLYNAYYYYNLAQILDYKPRPHYNMGILFTKTDFVSALYYFVRAYLLGKGELRVAKSDALELHWQANNKRRTEKDSYWFALSKVVEKPVKYNNRWFKDKQWILPDPMGKTEEPRPHPVVPPCMKEHLDSLTDNALLDRFRTTFISLMGSVFSKIGMDEFEEVAEENLVYFEGILRRKTSRQLLSFGTMVRIPGVIMDLADDLIKEKERCTEKGLQQDQIIMNLSLVVQYMMEIFSLAAERVADIMMLMDWENPLLEALSAVVLILSAWLKDNSKTWASRHCRPRFSIRRIERSRNINKADLTDDHFVAVAKLLTQLDFFLTPVRCLAFPELYRRPEEATNLDGLEPLPSLPELTAISNLSPSMLRTGYIFGDLVYMKPHPLDWKYNEKIKVRLWVILRLFEIRSFLMETFVHSYKLIKRTPNIPRGTEPQAPGKFTVAEKGNLQAPKEVKDSTGLHEGNYWFWVRNAERMRKDDEDEAFRKRNKRQRFPDCNGACSIVVRKKGSVWYHPRTHRPPDIQGIPQSFANQVWCFLNQKGFRCEMIVYTRWVILDTNCYINELSWVKSLVRILPYPIMVPITVCLELRGLAKGGMKLRHRELFKDEDFTSAKALEKIREGNEAAISAKEALDFISGNFQCFRIITQRGRPLKVGSVYDRLRDENYDPNQRPDNRILEAAMYLEHYDKRYRKLDTPMRMYRRTLLVTADAGVRVKCITNDIPTLEIQPFTTWTDQINKPVAENPDGKLRRKKGGRGRGMRYRKY